LLHDSHWLQRTVGSIESKTEQQYVYAMEANITFKNGLSIPLLTEYLSMENNQLINPTSKQDCELNAFKRLTERLKRHFPRLKIIVFMDALYATQSVMGVLQQYRWEYIINFSKNKLKIFAKILNRQRKFKPIIPGQLHYRRRRQEFYWKNNLEYGYDWNLRVSLVA
jgi:hypothetical protein